LPLLNTAARGQSVPPESKELWGKTATLPKVLSDEIRDAKINYLIKELNEEYVTSEGQKIIPWYKMRRAIAEVFS
jgi:hypothetical protein